MLKLSIPLEIVFIDLTEPFLLLVSNIRINEGQYRLSYLYCVFGKCISAIPLQHFLSLALCCNKTDLPIYLYAIIPGLRFSYMHTLCIRSWTNKNYWSQYSLFLTHFPEAYKLLIKQPLSLLISMKVIDLSIYPASNIWILIFSSGYSRFR